MYIDEYGEIMYRLHKFVKTSKNTMQIIIEVGMVIATIFAEYHKRES